MNWKAHVDEEMSALPDSSWMTSNTQANHQFPSHKHVTKPTIDSGGRSFVLRVTLCTLEVSELE